MTQSSAGVNKMAFMRMLLPLTLLVAISSCTNNTAEGVVDAGYGADMASDTRELGNQRLLAEVNNTPGVLALSHVVELDRISGAIGRLEVETVFINIDGSPSYKTTVVNSSDRDIWWAGLRTGTTSASYRSVVESQGEDELFGGKSGHSRSIGCYAGSSSAFNPEKNIDYLMKPGAVRVFEKSMDKPEKGFGFTSWSFHGETDYPSLEPLVDYPAFDVPLSFNWDEEEGCSVVIAENE